MRGKREGEGGTFVGEIKQAVVLCIVLELTHVPCVEEAFVRRSIAGMDVLYVLHH